MRYRLWLLFLTVADFLHVVLLSFLLACGFLYLSKLYSPVVFAETIKAHPGLFYDFSIYYVFGKLGLSSAHEKLYEQATQLNWLNSHIPGGVVGQTFLQYPPFFVLFMAPLTFLPIQRAYLIFSFVSALFGLLGISYLSVKLKSTNRGSYWAIGLGTLASLPAWRCFILGQTSWFMLGLISCFFVFVKQKRDLLAGVVLTLISFKPHWAIFLGLVLMAQRRWKAITFALLASSLLWGASACLIGLSVIISYPAVLTSMLKNPENLMLHQLIVAKGFFFMLFPDVLAHGLTLLLLIAGMTTIYFIWQKSNFNDNLVFNWAMATTVLIALIVSPHGHLYDLLYLAIPAVACLPTVRLSQILSLQSLPFRLWCLTLVIYPLVSWAWYVLVGQMSPICFPAFLFADIWLLAGSLWFLKQATLGWVH